MYLETLEGDIEKSTGNISLEFKSKFLCSLFSLFRFPALIVNTTLSNKKVCSKRHRVEGRAIQNNGASTLVGIATIEPTGNKLLDLFLLLPNEALAILECEILFKYSTNESVKLEDLRD